MKYDLYNPSSARRVIHDNLASARRIEILPRETAKGVALADHVVAHLRKLEASDADHLLELRITESAAAAEPEAPAPVGVMKIDEDKVTVVKAKKTREELASELVKSRSNA